MNCLIGLNKNMHLPITLVPLEFDQRANIYYAEMDKPAVNSTTFWNVYLQLLKNFQTNDKANTELLPLMLAHTDVIQDVNEERLDLLFGLKELQEGGAVVEKHHVDGDAPPSLYVDITESLDLSSSSDSNLDG